MALVADFHCIECDQDKHEVVDGSRVCASCRTAKASLAKRVFLSGLKGMTVEERLARIEALLYDANVEARLRSLEAHHIRY